MYDFPAIMLDELNLNFFGSFKCYGKLIYFVSTFVPPTLINNISTLC